MPCFHPHRAYRTKDGEVRLGRDLPDSHHLQLPCGNCLGCRMTKARHWTLRCQLELQRHDSALFTTLTYDSRNLPPTLDRRHLQLWLKRLRKAARKSWPTQRLRFFASGEYGETNQRPHYHAILYGLDMAADRVIQDTWQQGFTRTHHVTPAAIAYVAGYTSKKIGYKKLITDERVDPETGEVYTWQPPFIQMSRRPGIGAHARQWPESWRTHAVLNGKPISTPRFLHEAWKKQATPQQLEELLDEQYKETLTRHKNTEQQLQALEKIAITQQNLTAARRQL